MCWIYAFCTELTRCASSVVCDIIRLVVLPQWSKLRFLFSGILGVFLSLTIIQLEPLLESSAISFDFILSAAKVNKIRDWQIAICLIDVFISLEYFIYMATGEVEWGKPAEPCIKSGGIVLIDFCTHYKIIQHFLCWYKLFDTIKSLSAKCFVVCYFFFSITSSDFVPYSELCGLPKVVGYHVILAGFRRR